MMTNFVIPKELQETLNEDRALAGLVNTAISEFGVWLGRNNVKFFAEYTDHSLQHVQDVLTTADELIREPCRQMMKSADVAVLVLSVLLHDCAMHISIDGFINLVQSNHQRIIDGFNDKPWNMLWLDFLAESRRYSGRKLMSLFGDTEPVRHPPMNSQEMNGKDLLLCGEFLRKHHHRLAHEIALFGVPGHSEDKLQLPRTEDMQHIVDLAGVIARSHGLAIRDCFDYLKLRYSGVKLVKSVHPVYMMALLRIADILQIQQERAPKQLQKIALLKSPVSLAEWEMHQAITDVRFNETPETIFVVADPKNVGTYLKIRKMLDQIQNELDKSWTVIGEVYSYDPKFREFGLNIRRIRSNIDDLEAFSQRVNYVPVQASFDVADTDLLKLLIAPLYGDDPAVGIRELLQNAIDAVREREEYQKLRPELQNIELPDHEGDILISIDQEKDGKWWITVSDKGMGMTPETLREYFLKAGASLRRSEIWKKTFEDEEGKSTVLRSGRFGIGALATFLLGNEIYVSTRHITDKSGEGIQFQSRLDTAAIEFQKFKRPVGTEIRVEISDTAKDRLEKDQKHWNWYYLDKPVIVRKLAGEVLSQNEHLPNPNNKLPDSWRRISYKGYEDIQWTYSKEGSLFVNGIFINENRLLSTRSYIDRFYSIYASSELVRHQVAFRFPSLSIFDFDANFPLNLQRTDITSSTYPFLDEITNDVLKDFIAFLLVYGPTEPLTDINTTLWYFDYNYAGASEDGLYPFHLLDEKLYETSWCTTEDGFCLDNYWGLKRSEAKIALIVPFYLDLGRGATPFAPKPRYIPPIYVKSGQVISGLKTPIPKTLGNKVNYLNQVLEFLIKPYKNREIGYFVEQHHLLFHAGIRILISRNVVKLLSSAQEHSAYSGFKPFWVASEIDIDHVEEWGNDNWVLWKIGDCGANEFDFIEFAEENSNPDDDQWPCILVENYFLEQKPKYEDFSGKLRRQLHGDLAKVFEISALEKVWVDVLGSPIILFDLKQRREKFAHAYEVLKPYIEAHEATKAKDEDQSNIIE